MSSKFKIRAKDTDAAYGWKIGDEFETFVGILGDIVFIDNCGDLRHFEANKPYFELVTPANTHQSPVKERVVKEIVAGVYGIVNVPPNAGKVSLVPKARDYTAEDLRHAARVFNDLAEALESKQDA